MILSLTLVLSGFNTKYISNYRVPLLHYIKLRASYKTPRWIQTRVTVRKRSMWAKIGDFFTRVTLKFDGWRWKTIEHLVYVTSSFAHHFIAIGEFKLELQPGNAQLRQNSRIFLFHATLEFDGWPWKTIEHLVYVTSSFVHHFIAICEFKLGLQSGNAQFGLKSEIFCPMWPWNLTNDLEKQ